MSTSETLYTARVAPEYSERGRTQTIKCQTNRDGALAAPTSGTVSVCDESGAAVVDAVAVTILGSVAQYSLLASVTTGGDLGLGWRVEWALTMPDSVVHSFRVEGALVRRRLYPVVTDVDLKRRHSDLDDIRPASLTSYQDYLDEAWQDITDRLVQMGVLPFLVMSPGSFRSAHLSHTLQLIFLDFGSSAGDGRYLELAGIYEAKFKDSWSALSKVVYDVDHDGEADGDADELKTLHLPVFLA